MMKDSKPLSDTISVPGTRCRRVPPGGESLYAGVALRQREQSEATQTEGLLPRLSLNAVH